MWYGPIDSQRLQIESPKPNHTDPSTFYSVALEKRQEAAKSSKTAPPKQFQTMGPFARNNNTL